MVNKQEKSVNKEGMHANWSFKEGTLEYELFKHLNKDKQSRKSKILEILSTFLIPEIACDNPEALENPQLKRELDKSQIRLRQFLEFYEELGVFKQNHSNLSLVNNELLEDNNICESDDEEDEGEEEDDFVDLDINNVCD